MWVLELRHEHELTLNALTGDAAQTLVLELTPVLLASGGGISGADAAYVYTQNVAASVWTVPHNLNKRPSVTVANHLGEQVLADVRYIDDNIVQISHGTPFLGDAYFN